MKIIKIAITLILINLLVSQPGYGQTRGQETINREIKLYNPFKPTLQDVNKRLFFPQMLDSVGQRKEVDYSITPGTFAPRYKVSEIKAATIDPDPLPKLYKGFVRAGFGNYVTPLAEISITNERSKKGAFGFYAKHFSSHGKMSLDNDAKVPGGFMDNDALLYGKKFLRRSVFEASASFSFDTRYAYGYYTDSVPAVDLAKDDVKLNYLSAGGEIGYYSHGTDSSDFSYDFGLGFDHFRSTPDLWYNNISFRGKGGTEAFGFYTEAAIDYDLYLMNDLADPNPLHFFSFNPSISKQGAEWIFKLGVTADITSGTDHESAIPDETKTTVHLFPDVMFGFDIVPKILNFHILLDGEVEKNDAKWAASVNPWIMNDGSLFRINHTINKMRASVGVNGSVTEKLEYRLGTSYTFVENMVMFTSTVRYNTLSSSWWQMGNYFDPLYDSGEILKVTGELTAEVTDQISLTGEANYFSYSLSEFETAWNMPDWTASLRLDYNLRNKIIANIGFNAISARTGFFTTIRDLNPGVEREIDMPAHINMSLGAEYRYTKILSFWTKFTNVGFNSYTEYPFYPSRRFLFLAGFTYSL